jgi:hypothetical protein
MRKKIIGGIAAVAIGAAIALNINVAKSSDNLSDVFLSNVEALANTDIEDGSNCYNRVALDSGTSWALIVPYCGGCIYVYATYASNPGNC